MKTNNTKFRTIRFLVGIILLALAASFSFIFPANADSLYVGDGGDDTVKRFDARTGAYLGEFVLPGSGGINGPRGMIFTQGRLFLANQNVDQAFAGEILRYRRNTGDFLNALVPCNPPLGRVCDDDAPFAPRGIIRGAGRTLYVADHDGARVAIYDLDSGMFISNLDTTGFSGVLPAHPGLIFPRGIVRGPDDLLYVSVTALPAGNRLTGFILRFNPRTGKFVDVFTSNSASGCAAHLHRPEGLVFGPDNKLYVTVFRADQNGEVNDNDKILVFNRNGSCVDQINLAQPESQVGANERAFAQALVFGPGGRLFVPINGPVVGVTGAVTGNHTGEIRRYNTRTKSFSLLVPSAANGGALQIPWYLTFGDTDPRTLEYDD